jgi:hypothetical protein
MDLGKRLARCLSGFRGSRYCGILSEGYAAFKEQPLGQHKISNLHHPRFLVSMREANCTSLRVQKVICEKFNSTQTNPTTRKRVEFVFMVQNFLLDLKLS